MIAKRKKAKKKRTTKAPRAAKKKSAKKKASRSRKKGKRSPKKNRARSKKSSTPKKPRRQAALGALGGKGRAEQLFLAPPPTRPDDPVAQADAQVMLEKILPKLIEKIPLTKHEAAVARRYEKAKAERYRDAGMRALPQKDLEGLLQTPRKVLLEWEEAGMPRNADKPRTYDLFRVIAWVKDRWLAQAKAKQSDPADTEWERRWKRSRALKAERDLDESEGRLVAREEIEEQLAEAVRTVRARLEVLGDRVAPLCAGLEERGIASVVDREVSIVLEEFARAAAGVPEQEEGAASA